MNLPPPNLAKRHWTVIACLIAAGIIGAASILGADRTRTADAHDRAGEAHAAHGDVHHDEHGAAEAPKGPHGGQLLGQGDFAVEIALAEEGGKALVRTWLFNQDGAKSKPLPPAGVKLAITLTRPGGEQQRLDMAPTEDGFVSTAPVAEPHVFDAQIEVRTATGPFLFGWGQQEGKLNMTDAQIKSAGITVARATAATLRSSLQLPGEIRFNEDRTAHVVPRVAGVVESVNVDLGQRVRKGQVLAVIGSPAVSEQRSELQTAQQRARLARTTWEREKKLWEEKISPQQDMLQAEQALREAEIAVANARQKLQAIGADASAHALARYELRAPFDAMVIEKHIALGEAVKEDGNVFTLSDLTSVWAEVDISAKDINQVRVGERVAVRSTAAHETASGTVAYVGALLGEQTRTAKGRVTLANPKGAWRPGLFVTVELTTAETEAAITVANDAIHQVDGKSVVFLKVPGGFVPQPVELGRSDGRRTEVRSGLKTDAEHAAAGSFIVKAEAGKGAATHSH